MDFKNIIKTIVFEIPELDKFVKDTIKDYGQPTEYVFFGFLMALYTDLYRNINKGDNKVLLVKISRRNVVFKGGGCGNTCCYVIPRKFGCYLRGI